ncbi:hypothetical protein BJY01DRAFT_245626 [Aspergillus pseudoustus]|uniref:Zn(2)-C6 fungal-type domain-containing protein n=1 Tax=Aspergillus pseudoustus TaxID=1810923 RepID=A0ABR4KD05_9EURO
MSSPSGSNASYAPDRPARFKDSCDSCAQAKVKCSRDRPSCQRCVRSGFVCHYSLARRGKAASAASAARHVNPPKPPGPRTPPRSVTSLAEVFSGHAPDLTSIEDEFSLSADFMSRHANPPKSPARRALQQSVTSLTEDFSSHAPDLTSFDEGFSLSADFLSSRGFDAHRMAGLPHEIDAAPHESSLDFSLLSRLGNGDSSRREVPIPEMTAIESALLALPPDPTNPQLGTKTFGTGGTGNTLTPDSSENIRVVLATLESLHMPSTMPTPSIDMILKVNNMAMGNLSALLKDPCGLKCPNITLLALVCCNGIIDAYQQLLLAQRDSASADDEKDRSEDAMDLSFSTAAIAANMQITVGEFLPDSSVKQKIISSVLLSELTRLGNIIERIIPSRKNPALSASRNIKDGGEFISTLKPLLKEKLRVIVRVVKAAIMQSDEI